MLLIAAALLTASMHSLRVVEATPVPETGHVMVLASDRSQDPSSTLRDRVHADAGSGVHGDASDGGVDAAEHATGKAFLDDMAALDARGLRTLQSSSRAQSTAFDAPPSAATVEAWWDGQSDATRERLVHDAPYLVGNLEGVPYAVRDEANRAALRTMLREAHADGSASSDESAMLGQVAGALVQAPGSPEKQLLTLDARGSGRAAIAIGDLQTASDVTVMVPGMFFTVTGQMEDWTATGGDIYAEQATLSGRLATSASATTAAPATAAASTTTAAPAAAAAQGTSTGGGVAVLAWMGYQTPDLSNVLSLDLAHVGATRLERVVTGIDTVRSGAEPRVNVVAHSYGSTTALMALSSGRIHVDSLTLFGSPGSSVSSASDLHVTKGQVFVGDAHWDPVAGTGYFGVDPGSSGFGSTLLDLAGGADPNDDDDAFTQPFGHNDYLKPGTASLHDLALIAIGRSDLVQRSDDPNDPSDQNGGGSPQFLVVRPQDLALRD